MAGAAAAEAALVAAPPVRATPTARAINPPEGGGENPHGVDVVTGARGSMTVAGARGSRST